MILNSCIAISNKKIVLSKDEKVSIEVVRDFIKTNWEKTIRTHTNDSASLIGLPLPYSVPSISGMFQEMYYWDTYFTNVGLIMDGNVIQARNNCENMLYLIDRYGFMPNGNRIWYLNRSQPPYLSMMIRDVYEKTKDKEWLKRCLPTLEKEYHFWMTKRITSIGLNRFNNNAPDSINEDTFWGIKKRLGENYDTISLKSESQRIAIGSHFTSEFESGWDLSPRFDSRCNDFCPLDLNSNLYLYEKNFEYFYSKTENNTSKKWNSIADKRKKLINKYLYNQNDKLFYDYDYVNNQLSPIYSSAVFNALWAELLTQEQAKELVKHLPPLEFKYGLAACAPGKRKYAYQWDYPNGWASIQYLAVKGLRNYGYKAEASRIAYKYATLVSSNYKKTNNLWEKYNIIDGTINGHNEYEMPTMMGWTAGTFIYISDYLMNE
jgi:alpha,alpha-trehalase